MHASIARAPALISRLRTYMNIRPIERQRRYRASFVDSEILTARTCFIHVHQERMIKRDVARREGLVCARGRRSYVRTYAYRAYKYACDTYVVHACDTRATRVLHAWDTRALVKLPLGGTVCATSLYSVHGDISKSPKNDGSLIEYVHVFKPRRR